MSASPAQTQCSPDDLLAMTAGDCYELINGTLVKREMGSLSSWVGGKLLRLIGSFGEDHNLGWAFPADAGYQCFADDPDKVRKPDVSFVLRGRLPNEQVPEGWIRIPPDLAVEVLSPNDLATVIDVKVKEYLDAGVRIVWVVNPETRTVIVHRADGSVSKLLENGELSGEDVLPGFECRVAEIFPPATEKSSG